MEDSGDTLSPPEGILNHLPTGGSEPHRAVDIVQMALSAICSQTVQSISIFTAHMVVVAPALEALFRLEIMLDDKYDMLIFHDN